MGRTLRTDVDAQLYAPGDRNGLEAGLAALMADESRRDRIGRAGRATFLSTFSMEAQLDAVERVLRS